MNHRALQRTLFRMQADPEFARALLAREPEAVRASDLTQEELARIEGLDERALRADPGGKRRTQILGNASSEYRLALAAAARSEDAASFLGAFASSAEFHEALRKEGRLPLAFGAYAARRAEETNDPVLAAIVTLERAMVALRRDAVRELRTPTVTPLGEGELILSPLVRIVALRAGTMDLAAELARDLRGEDGPAVACLAPGQERVLLRAQEPPSVHAIADVAVELLQPPVDELLALAAIPLAASARADFARQKGATPEVLERFLAGYVSEGVLLRG